MLVCTHGPISSWIATPVGVAYAPTLASERMRIARMRPFASSASSAWLRTSRPCTAPRNSSLRSAHHLTGRFRCRAAKATAASSGYRPVFMPKPPPTSPTTTRTFSLGIFSRSCATVSRAPEGICVLIRSVRRSLASSYVASTARGSIADGASRWFTRSSDTTCAAARNAASAAPASPCRFAAARLPGASSKPSGAPGAVASSSSRTAGRSS